MKRKINLIVVHCSDSRDGDSEIINGWHQKRGFDKCGYHYIIKKDGTIEHNLFTRSVQEIGAHCRGYNKHSIGICLIGKNYFIRKQFDSLDRLIKDLHPFIDDDFKILCHYKLNPKKTCPNFTQEFLDKKFTERVLLA